MDLTPAVLEGLREKGSARFFNEPGVPPHIREGWLKYEERRKVREKAGVPLPSGGVLLLGRESVIAGCMLEMHSYLSDKLDIPRENIRLKLEKNPGGGIRPVADVTFPVDHEVAYVPLDSSQHKDPKQLTKEYLEFMIGGARDMFKKSLAERFKAVERIRKDISQPIKAWETDDEESPS